MWGCSPYPGKIASAKFQPGFCLACLTTRCTLNLTIIRAGCYYNVKFIIRTVIPYRGTIMTQDIYKMDSMELFKYISALLESMGLNVPGESWRSIAKMIEGQTPGNCKTAARSR